MAFTWRCILLILIVSFGNSLFSFSGSTSDSFTFHITEAELNDLARYLYEADDATASPLIASLRHAAISSSVPLTAVVADEDTPRCSRARLGMTLVITGFMSTFSGILTIAMGSLAWTNELYCPRIAAGSNSTCPANPGTSVVDPYLCPSENKPCYCGNITIDVGSNGSTSPKPDCNVDQLHVSGTYSFSAHGGHGFCLTPIPNIVDPACISGVETVMMSVYAAGGSAVVAGIASMLIGWQMLAHATAPAPVPEQVLPDQITVIEPAPINEFVARINSLQPTILSIAGDDENGYQITVHQQEILAQLQGLGCSFLSPCALD